MSPARFSLLLLSACAAWRAAEPDDGPPTELLDAWGDTPTEGRSLQVLPTEIDFGSVATGCDSSEVTVWIRNVSGVEVQLTGFALDGASTEVWALVPSVPVVLAPGVWLSAQLSYAPEVDGTPGGELVLTTTAADAPEIRRSLWGEACGDLDADGTCDVEDADRDGDGILDSIDRFPDLPDRDRVTIDFDDLTAGAEISQLEFDGLSFDGGGSPGEGLDTSVVAVGSDCTGAELQSSPNLLCAWVNEGFNHSGDPGLRGTLHQPADAIAVRLYNAGVAWTSDGDSDTDQATLTGLDEAGAELDAHTDTASTGSGEEWVDLHVHGPDLAAFTLHTGDFEAVDDVSLHWFDEAACP